MTSNLREDEFRKYLRPEFINRIDDILKFNDLDQDAVKVIVNIQLNHIIYRMAEQNIYVKLSDDVKSYLVKNGYDPEYGARPIKRIIRREILAGLSRFLLEFPEVRQVLISIKDNVVQFHSAILKQQAA